MKFAKQKIWALVADGSHATIVKNFTRRTCDEIITRESHHQSASELVSDRAGRCFTSFSPRRSAMESHSDPVRANEQAFTQELLEELELAYDFGSVEKLLIFAAPKTLGDIRRAISRRLRSIVVLESNKNLTHLPRKELVTAINEIRFA